MKFKLLSDLQAVSDDPVFFVTANEIGASFIPSSQPDEHHHNPCAARNFCGDVPVKSGPRSNAPAGFELNFSGPSEHPCGDVAVRSGPRSNAPAELNSNSVVQASTLTVPISSEAYTINLLFDNAATNIAPASFRAGIEQEAALLAAAITDKITVNIRVDYSDMAWRGAYDPGEYSVGGLFRCQGRPDQPCRAGRHTSNALPGWIIVQGPKQRRCLPGAQASSGACSAPTTLRRMMAIAIFAKDIDPTLLAGTALHELTHALGRVPGMVRSRMFSTCFAFTSPRGSAL